MLINIWTVWFIDESVYSSLTSLSLKIAPVKRIDSRRFHSKFLHTPYRKSVKTEWKIYYETVYSLCNPCNKNFNIRTIKNFIAKFVKPGKVNLLNSRNLKAKIQKGVKYFYW